MKLDQTIGFLKSKRPGVYIHPGQAAALKKFKKIIMTKYLIPIAIVLAGTIIAGAD